MKIDIGRTGNFGFSLCLWQLCRTALALPKCGCLYAIVYMRLLTMEHHKSAIQKIRKNKTNLNKNLNFTQQLLLREHVLLAAKATSKIALN